MIFNYNLFNIFIIKNIEGYNDKASNSYIINSIFL